MYSFQKKLYLSCCISTRKTFLFSKFPSDPKKYLRSRKLEKLKDRKISMIVGTRTVYFVPSLISHDPGYAEGIRKKETRGIWWLVKPGANSFPPVLSVINIFKVPRHDNKYVHRKNCLTFPCSPVRNGERLGISLVERWRRVGARIERWGRGEEGGGEGKKSEEENSCDRRVRYNS